jgi:hypothetical protein
MRQPAGRSPGWRPGTAIAARWWQRPQGEDSRKSWQMSSVSSARIRWAYSQLRLPAVVRVDNRSRWISDFSRLNASSISHLARHRRATQQRFRTLPVGDFQVTEAALAEVVDPASANRSPCCLAGSDCCHRRYAGNARPRAVACPPPGPPAGDERCRPERPRTGATARSTIAR